MRWRRCARLLTWRASSFILFPLLPFFFQSAATSFEDSDVDLFFYGVDADSDEPQRMFRAIFEAVVKNTNASGNVRCVNSWKWSRLLIRVG